MRISALHLLAYGHFSNRILSFGAEPRLHIIYGSNEAGKTTSLRALSSVLFGYPQQVIDGFLHDAKDILLGAELVAASGQTLSFQRKRRGKNPLTYASGSPLDEVELKKILGGVSKDMFERVFALDHHRLHDDARTLLSEGGTLGFTLASVGSGLPGLKACIDRIKTDRGALFLPGGSKPKINQQIGKLFATRKEARSRTVSPEQYRKRQKEIDETETSLNEERARGRGIDQELHKLERVLRNLPIRAQHSALLFKLDGLASVPLLPVDAREKRIIAEADRDGAQQDINLASDAAESLEAQINAIAIDQPVIDKARNIEALAQRRAVIEEAEKAIPRREAERSLHYSAARNLLANAELDGSPTDLSDILPSLLKRKQVSVAAEKGRALAVKSETLAKAVASLKQDVRIAGEGLQKTKEPTDLSPIVMALANAETLGDVSAEIIRRRRVLSARTTSIRDAIVGLGIGSGDASMLRQLTVPSEETVARYRASFSNAATEQANHDAECARLDAEMVRIRSHIDSLAVSGATATIEELEGSRGERGEAWSLLREIYIDKKEVDEGRVHAIAQDGDIVGAFERRQTAADSVADKIIAHSKGAAELSVASRQKIAVHTKISAAVASGHETASRRAKLETEWIDVWPAAGFRIQPPAEMAEWIKQRSAILHDDTDQQAEENAIAVLEKREADSRAALLDALRPVIAVDENGTLETLRVAARNLTKTGASLAAEHARAVDLLRSETLRHQKAVIDQEQNAEQVSAWSENWRAALREASLRKSLSIDAAATILDIMAELDGLSLKIEEQTHRISAMVEDKSQFEASVTALGSIASSEGDQSATQISEGLSARLEDAKAAQNSRSSLVEQRKIHLDAQQQATERLTRSSKMLASLCEVAGCEESSELNEIEQLSASKQESIREREELEKRLLQDGAGMGLEYLLSECDGVDGDLLPGKIATLKSDKANVEENVESLIAQRTKLRTEFDTLFGQSEAAESFQDAANVEADIALLTASYTDLTLQEIVLRRAIELYRDRNQGPIIGRAKGLFAQLTDGAYSGLRADVDEDDQPILVAEHKTRGSLELGALSDGTIDPLYLALRLAVVEEHNDKNEPMPFIADDLLLSLDRSRAQATFRTLAMIAQRSQVLFFTHHDHMADLARACVPAALLVEHQL